jgi:hypothetical protein
MDSEKHIDDVGPVQTISSETSNNRDDSIISDPQVVRKLRLKFDLIILPTLATMYTFKLSQTMMPPRSI